MSKVILFYYESLRSRLIYQKVLQDNPGLFSAVVEMPALPYQRKTERRNYTLLKKMLRSSFEFVVMTTATVFVYRFFCQLSSSSIKSFACRLGIPYKHFKKIDRQLLDWLALQKPDWIISSTSTILTKDFIDIPRLGVLNFHEAPLPAYRGSACYFWMIADGCKDAHVTMMYVNEGLDTGNVIFEGPKVIIGPRTSVFDLWWRLLGSYSSIFAKALPYLEKGIPFPSAPQPMSSRPACSYPEGKVARHISEKGHRIFSPSDLLLVLKCALTRTSLERFRSVS